MKTKAFTLVEVLVVIVIIGVIMLITRPIAISIFENAKEKTFSVMVEKIIDATENYITDYEVEYDRVFPDTVIEIIDGKLDNNILRINGELPEKALIKIVGGQVAVSVYDSGMCGIRFIDDSKSSVIKTKKEDCDFNAIYVYRIEADDITIVKGTDIDFLEGVNFKYHDEVIDTIISYSTTNFNNNIIGSYQVVYNTIYDDIKYTATRTIYVIDNSFVLLDGTEIYYDVLNGRLCSDYHEDNSITGYNGTAETKTTKNQTNCLKFYVFNDDVEDTTLKLILDHNTTPSSAWTNYTTTSNIGGPINALSLLKNSTSLWAGTKIPSNYAVKQNGYGNYEIPYATEKYKARLITANEVAEIAGNDGWHESTADMYYSVSPEVGWLYDRTSSTCKTHGCLNNATGNNISDMQGYWTSTSSIRATNGAWRVTYDRSINSYSIQYGNYYGIRPVIEINKGQLSGLYTLTLDPNGGTWNGSTNIHTFRLNNSDIMNIPYPVKDGYVFGGWNVNGAESSIKGSILEMGSEDTIITAKWVRRNEYENGTIVYYDVLNGNLCNNYHVDNSITGYDGTVSSKTTNNQNSCLKFYIFNDDVGDLSINMLLDHNTTGVSAWNSFGTSVDGPLEALLEISDATDSWVGTNRLQNYSVSQSLSGNYVIPYNTDNYKARLLTANDIAEITGKSTFNEITADSNNWYYFDTLTSGNSQLCNSANTSGCSYGWLYDRTNSSCTDYGCLNNAVGSVDTLGYWLGTSIAGNSSAIWSVNFDASLNYGYAASYSVYGIRPVIELGKNLFNKIYNLTINPNGGVYENTYSNIYFGIEEGKTYNLKTPTKEGYLFAGWEISGSGSTVNNSILTMGAADTVLTAKWEIEDGTPIYYDVSNGKLCSNYHIDNSLTGYNGIGGTGNQTSCLKFYAFNDDAGDERVNLILDHNTTHDASWGVYGTSSNANGPVKVLEKLQTDTNSWVGTMTPENYSVTQVGYGNYTIPYKTNNYKARMITANEIAEIIGNTTWKESTSSNNLSVSEYGWLYDRTSSDCTTYGCLNNAESTMTAKGYWTGTSTFGSAAGAWRIDNTGSMYSYNVQYGLDFGVRPVIEIDKELLKN